MIKLIGYGNPARGDDGLGPACAEMARGWDLSGLEIRTDFQLSVEHALWLSEARQVIFVDAALGPGPAFRFAPLLPSTSSALTSHALDPTAVLALSKMLYGAEPQAHVLAITGHDFGHIHEGLSPEARSGLHAATTHLRHWLLRQPEIRPTAAPPQAHQPARRTDGQAHPA